MDNSPYDAENFFAAQTAKTAGDVVYCSEEEWRGKSDCFHAPGYVLNTGGSLEFTVENQYSDGTFSLSTDIYWHAICDVALYVNSSKINEFTANVSRGDCNANQNVHLNKGSNSIKFVNEETEPDPLIVKGITLKENW